MAKNVKLEIQVSQSQAPITFSALPFFTMVTNILGKLTLVRNVHGQNTKVGFVNRATLRQARADDFRNIWTFLNIHFANVIPKLGKKIRLRQRVIAAGVVFFRRLYLKSSYRETDPFLVIVACCYVMSLQRQKNRRYISRMSFRNLEPFSS
ncbi:hypothetical protein WG66_007579, partial [Moniliophthora roreri]